MDQWTVLSRCYDASSKLSKPPLTFICSKVLSSFVFYESVTNQRTDGPMDGPTDGRTDGYRDARTHLKSVQQGKGRVTVLVSCQTEIKFNFDITMKLAG